MRVLFIYPNLFSQIGFNYGIAYISAFLKRKGHEVSLIHLNEKLGYVLDFERIKRDIKRFSPDLVAFSIVTNQYRFALDLASFIKKNFDIPIVCGGIHPTFAFSEILKTGVFDIVCRGEGELFLAELLEKLEKNEDISNIRNLCMKNEEKIIVNKVRPYVDLNTLPMKDYEIFDFQKIINIKNGWVGILTSRGCPFKCSYCFNYPFRKIYEDDLGKRRGGISSYLRRHKIEDVISEMIYLISNYQNIKIFIFDDDIFTLDREYLINFCKEYKKYIGLPFVCNCHVKFFDREIALILKEAGCIIVKFGVESGNEFIRSKILKRKMKNSEIAKAFEIAKNVGLHTSAFLMIGLPKENIRRLKDTIKLIANIHPGRFRWSIFFPYPGTSIYEIAKEENLLKDEKKLYEYSNFFDKSPLDFGERQNLYIDKLSKVFPWFVNAYSNFKVSEIYKNLVNFILKLDKSSWDSFKKDIKKLDETISNLLSLIDEEHYAIKYNDFMGVNSNWFNKEGKFY